ncbi:molybdopterin-dependent oxidoreductase [Clostridium pasteurianum]|uniref:Anaerobic dehydrogenase, typically selenocysteine-containing n=1 Tax=Clostridium pasteurianum BC1 TaxID=86416 RepID=R4K723_CLOPA|nr:molybdopterin-dependent oxidoreductase [Clostridium pasteurianum]AGK98977.1 anaerobic dehydrogenase, typically selenocysteine-containing [Clostridium pasteurianum BC1]
MSNFIDKLVNTKVDRRKFLKGSAAVAAAVAGLPLVAYDNTLKETTLKEKDVGHINTDTGKWVAAACWHNCGGRCLVKALVVEGVVVRQKTDDLREDTDDNPQQRACLRGRAEQFEAQGADRLKYPMKRKHWKPGGGDKSLRGKDEWERISWNEALKYIADEIIRIKNKYGVESIFSTSIEPAALLNKIGPYVSHWGTTSYGAWHAVPHILGIGDGGVVKDKINDRFDLQKSELVVGFGLNPAWSSFGNQTHWYLEMKKKGCKFVIIDPVYTDTAATLEAEWIPIKPGTDMTLQLALAYTMLQEDDPVKNPLIDWDFLNCCTYGFDAEHMPPDAIVNENFKDYLLGKYDNIPKTPEWAEEICGVSSDTTRKLARRIGKNTRVSLLTSWASARTYDSDSLPQLFITLGAMGGHIGKSGHNTGVSCSGTCGNFGKALVVAGSDGMVSKAKTYTPLYLNDTEGWKAILEGSYNPSAVFPSINGKPADWKKLLSKVDLTKKVEKKPINIQMIWHSANAILQSREGMKQGIQVHRKVEFVLSQSSFLTTNSKYADIVLPITTWWERGGNFAPSCNRDIMLVYSNVIKPIYEAKDDEWVNIQLGKLLDVPEKDMYPISEKQRFFNKLANSTVINKEGTGYEPLVEITSKDIEEWGCEGKLQSGRVPLNKFLADGIYQVERHDGDNYGNIAYEKFRNDPVKNPLNSATGLIEIYSQTKADILYSQGYSEISPLPKYVSPKNGYENTYLNLENKTKGKYPYQLINPHYPRRSHTIYDNVPWLREAMKQPAYISKRDADEKKIKNGDTVLITSAYGKTLRHAYVTERIVPGVIGLPHGSWVDVDESNGIDKAGADNYLCGNISTGAGVSGWNTQNVDLEKWTGSPLPDDVNIPQRIIF